MVPVGGEYLKDGGAGDGVLRHGAVVGRHRELRLVVVHIHNYNLHVRRVGHTGQPVVVGGHWGNKTSGSYGARKKERERERENVYVCEREKYIETSRPYGERER